MTEYERRKMEKQIRNEDLEKIDRARIAKQVRDEMEKERVEIADLVRRNPKLQNTQIQNFIKGNKDIMASTQNYIADALGGRIDFVPAKRRRRRK